MDTKWKNMTKEVKAFLKLNWPLLPGAVLILTGIYLEYFMLVDADYRPMDESVIIGLNHFMRNGKRQGKNWTGSPRRQGRCAWSLPIFTCTR